MSSWTPEMELLLLQAINCRPVGVRKHFHMISIHRQFNRRSSSVQLSTEELWERIGSVWDTATLDKLEGDHEHDVHEFERVKTAHSYGNLSEQRDFVLHPLQEFDALVSAASSKRRRSSVRSPVSAKEIGHDPISSDVGSALSSAEDLSDAGSVTRASKRRSRASTSTSKQPPLEKVTTPAEPPKRQRGRPRSREVSPSVSISDTPSTVSTRKTRSRRADASETPAPAARRRR